MNEPLDELYFSWLCAKVHNREHTTPSLSYETLLRTLFGTEFAWFHPRDENRAKDGVELRREFILVADIPDNPEWQYGYGCSMLEMLIALCRRAEFQTEISVQDWFWHIMENLGLNECNDASGITSEDIEQRLYFVIWREYDYSGAGGFFPLQDPHRDQTQVEIWYQFCDYLVDQEQFA